MRSLRYTTFPGVAAMFTPTSNPLLSTCDGHPPLCRTSSTMLRTPRTTLLPPVSNALRTATGLPANVFDGENASSRKRDANAALARVAPATPDIDTNRSTNSQVSKYSWASRKYSGLLRYASSANRLSPGFGCTVAAGSRPSATAAEDRTADAMPTAAWLATANVPAGFRNAPPLIETNDLNNAIGSTSRAALPATALTSANIGIPEFGIVITAHFHSSQSSRDIPVSAVVVATCVRSTPSEWRSDSQCLPAEYRAALG